MKKINIIQIGIGHDHACDILDSILSMPDIYCVKALVIPEEEEGKYNDRVARFNVPLLSLEEALQLNDINAAAIETEERYLTKYSLLCARHSLHIHMDKPGGFDYGEFEELVCALKQKRLTLSLGYMYRFNPFIKSAIEKAKSGELGEIYSVEAHMSVEHNAEKRAWLKGLPGGMMFFLGCHLVDLVYTIAGTPLKVTPFNASVNGVSEDFGMAVFTYPKGASFVKACAAETGGFLRRQLVICGEKGTITVSPLEDYDTEAKGRKNMFSNMHITLSDGSCYGLDRGQNYKAPLFNRYDAMMQNFHQMVIGEKENEYSYDYELSLHRLILEACGAEI